MFGGGKILLSSSSCPPLPAQRPLQGHQALAEQGHSQAHNPGKPLSPRSKGEGLESCWGLLASGLPMSTVRDGQGHCPWGWVTVVITAVGGAGAGSWSVRAGCTVGLNTCVLKGEPLWFGWPLATTCSTPRGQGFSV